MERKISLKKYLPALGLLTFLPSVTWAADTIFTNFAGGPPTKAADVTNFMSRIIDLLGVVIGIVALALIIWGGVMLATSWGSEDRITKGKAILTNTVIGFALSTAGYIIIKVVILALGGTV